MKQQQGQSTSTYVCWISSVFSACDWQKNKDTGFREERVCWELESGHSLWDNLRLMLLKSFWALPPEFGFQQVWSGVWDFAFLSSSQVVLLLLVLRPHLTFEAKRWAGSSPGRRIEEGTPAGMCPVLPVYFWPLPPEYLLPGVPLHCGWSMSRGFTTRWSNMLRLLFIQKEKIPTFAIMAL